jgi:hypothetical protein
LCRDRKNLLTDGKQRSAHVSGSGIPLWEECTKTHQKVRNNILFSYQPSLHGTGNCQKGRNWPPRPGTRNWGFGGPGNQVWGRFGPVWAVFPVWPISRSRKPPISPYSRVRFKCMDGSSNGKFPEFGRIQQKTAKNSVFPLTPAPNWGEYRPNRGNSWSGRAILGSPAGEANSGVWDPRIRDGPQFVRSQELVNSQVFSVLAEFDEFPNFVFFGVSKESLGLLYLVYAEIRSW